MIQFTQQQRENNTAGNENNSHIIIPSAQTPPLTTSERTLVLRSHSSERGSINAIHLSASPPGYWIELSRICVLRECSAEAAAEAFALVGFLIEGGAA